MNYLFSSHNFGLSSFLSLWLLGFLSSVIFNCLFYGQVSEKITLPGYLI